MSEPFDLGEPAADIRAAILGRTLRVQRARRIMRRIAAAAIVAIAYAAGFATPRPAAREPASPAPRIEAAARAVPRPESTDPRELEQRAARAASAGERAILLRAAGDAYIGDLGDVDAALRCYRQFLETSPPAKDESDPNDSWLLSALKRGRA